MRQKKVKYILGGLKWFEIPTVQRKLSKLCPIKSYKIFICVSTTQKPQGWVFGRIMKNSPKYSKESTHQLTWKVSYYNLCLELHYFVKMAFRQFQWVRTLKNWSNHKNKATFYYKLFENEEWKWPYFLDTVIFWWWKCCLHYLKFGPTLGPKGARDWNQMKRDQVSGVHFGHI